MVILYSNNPTWHKLFKIEELNIIRPYSIQKPIDVKNNYSIYTTHPLNRSNVWIRNNNWKIKNTDGIYELSIRIIKFRKNRLLNRFICENNDIKKYSNDIEYNNYFGISNIVYSQNGPSLNRKFKIVIDDTKFNLSDIEDCWFHVIPTKFINDNNIFSDIKIKDKIEICENKDEEETTEN